MRTTEKNQLSTDLFNSFQDNQLSYNEMFAVRGGGDGDDQKGGSQSDVQEDGFN